MFPTELQINEHRNEMMRTAEQQRLIKSLRSEPTLWQRLVARVSTSANSSATSVNYEQETQRATTNVVATSR